MADTDKPSKASGSDLEHFRKLMQPITQTISQSHVDADLEARLNRAFPPSSDTFRQIERACHAAIGAGWMCSQGSEGRRFGRVVEPCGETGNLSIDVVDLTDIVGPHHRHPTGRQVAGRRVVASGVVKRRQTCQNGEQMWRGAQPLTQRPGPGVDAFHLDVNGGR